MWRSIAVDWKLLSRNTDSMRFGLGRQRRRGREAKLRAMMQAGYRYAYSLTHHHQDAEDLAQQASMKVLRRYGDLQDRALLFVAIRNLFCDDYRRRAAVSFQHDQHDRMIDGKQNAMKSVEVRLDMEALLASLSSEEREILYLSCVEGFTAAEIGTLTGRPRGTILSLLSRTKKKLADRFGRSTDEKGACCDG